MTGIALGGKRILVTEAGTFMGPALCDVLRECGAEVIAAFQHSGIRSLEFT